MLSANMRISDGFVLLLMNRQRMVRLKKGRLRNLLKLPIFFKAGL